MRLRLARTATFVPKWNGNDEAPEGERVVFHWRYMTPEEQDTHVPLLRGDDDYDKRGVFRAMTQRIENLEVEDGTGSVVKIEGAEQFFRVRHTDLWQLFNEVVAEYLRRTFEHGDRDLKN